MAANVGTIDASLSTGNVAYTSVGFQPTALIVWSVNRATAGDSDSFDGAGFCRGMTDGTTTGCFAWTSDDDVSPGLPGSRQRSASIYRLDNAAGTILAEATFVSFDSDGFTLNWSTAAASSWDIHFLALGGVDYANVYVGTTVMTASGSHAVTGVGFLPTALISMAHTPPSGSAIAPWGWTTGDVHMSIGFTDGTTDVVMGARIGSSFVSARTSVTDGSLVWHKSSSTTELTADLTSFDADGFTLNVSAYGRDTEMLYLAINNPNVYVGTILTPAAPADVAETGVGFLPDALLSIVSNTSWSGSGNSEHASEVSISVGAASGASAERGTVVGRRDASTRQYRGIGEDLTHMVTLAAVPETPSVDSVLADLKSLDADGFTLTYTTTTTQEALFYIALSGGLVPGTFDNKLINADGISTV